MIPVQASESEWPPFSRLSLTSSVNSQTKTSKVRDDKLEAAITSAAEKNEGRIDIIGLEEREHCALVGGLVPRSCPRGLLPT
jgi:hypothetical protein